VIAGHLHDEPRAARPALRDHDAASVILRNIPHDRQARTGAAGPTCAGGIESGEALEDARAVGRLASRGYGHRFASASLGADHPYTALHYVLMNGAAATAAVLREAVARGEAVVAG